MLSRLLYTIENGCRQLIRTPKLLVIGLLVVGLPLALFFTSEQFLESAEERIAAAEYRRISGLHDAISVLVANDAELSTALDMFVVSNPDATVFRLYRPVSSSRVVITNSTNQNEVGLESDAAALTTALTEPNRTSIVQLNTASDRVVHARRALPDADLYLFSEHRLTLANRHIQQIAFTTYTSIALILCILIGMAYWINRQIDWRSRYDRSTERMRERDLFSNMIAHEFRAPLTAIKGYASLVHETNTLTVENRRHVAVIRESAERLVLLVNDFLEVARIQSGRMQLEYQNVDVRDLIQDTVQGLETLATESGLQLQYIKPLSAQLLQTDQNRLTQVLTNLVSNAIKYTDNGTITVTSDMKGKKLTVKIQDTGTGISASDQQKLFAPFSRVGEAAKSNVTGTGLGLWITKQLVELLGGTIMIESIKSVGTHVIVTLPITQSSTSKH
jgi:signal transduction histidine kinase